MVNKKTRSSSIGWSSGYLLKTYRDDFRKIAIQVLQIKYFISIEVQLLVEKRLSWVVTYLEVALCLTAQTEVRLQRHGVRHQQTRSDLGEEVQRRQTSHQPLRGSFASSAASSAATSAAVGAVALTVAARILT